jgi:excisionase family DNA binding protein
MEHSAMSQVETTKPMLFTLREAAEALGVSQRTLWGLAKNKQIRSVRVGPRGLRFSPAALQAFIEKQEQLSEQA